MPAGLRRNTPILRNWNATLPAVPRLPPPFEKMARTCATVRVGLSVAASTLIAASTLSFGMLTAREFCTARRSAGLELTSLPPALTAMLMSFATRANCFAMRSHRANIVCLRTSNMRPIGARILLDVPDRDGNVADVDVAGGPQEPRLAAVAARLDVLRE